MGLIRLLGIILIAYLAIRLITRYLLPLAGRYFVKKATNNMQEQMRSREQGEKIYQDEKVTIRKKDQSSPSSSDQGEYVDYEEVN
jgi:hypothetical protein